MNHLFAILQSCGYTVVVLGYWLLIKLIVDKFTPYDDDLEIETNKNLAISLMRCGLYFGLAIAMAGALTNGDEHSFSKDIVALLLDGAMIVPLLLVARIINDKLLLTICSSCGDTSKECSTDSALLSGNLAIGIAEFGSLLGAGLILNGSFAGPGPAWSAIPFFFLGQLVFVVIISLIERLGKYELCTKIQQGNVSAGIFLASKFTAMGLILRASIAGPSMGWQADLTSFAASAAIGTVILVLFNRIADWLFLPKSKDREQIDQRMNPAALLLAAFIENGLALIVSIVI